MVEWCKGVVYLFTGASNWYWRTVGQGKRGNVLFLLFLPFHSCSSFFCHSFWSGWVKQRYILRHRGIKRILAYSWARPTTLAASGSRGGRFLLLLFHHFHSALLVSSLSFIFLVFLRLFHLLYYLFYLFSPFLWETTQIYPQGLTCCCTPTMGVVGWCEGAVYLNYRGVQLILAQLGKACYPCSR